MENNYFCKTVTNSLLIFATDLVKSTMVNTHRSIHPFIYPSCTLGSYNHDEFKLTPKHTSVYLILFHLYYFCLGCWNLVFLVFIYLFILFNFSGIGIHSKNSSTSENILIEYECLNHGHKYTAPLNVKWPHFHFSFVNQFHSNKASDFNDS